MDEHDEKFDRKDRLLLPQSQDDAKIRHRGLPLNSMLGFRQEPMQREFGNIINLKERSKIFETQDSGIRGI